MALGPPGRQVADGLNAGRGVPGPLLRQQSSRAARPKRQTVGMIASLPPGPALADGPTADALGSYRRHARQWLFGSLLAAVVGLVLLGVSIGHPLLAVLAFVGVLGVCGAPTGVGMGVGGVVRARRMARLLAAGPWVSFPARYGPSGRGRVVVLEGADPDRGSYVLSGLAGRVDRFAAAHPATVLVAGYPDRWVVVTGADRTVLIVGTRPRRAAATARSRREALRPPLTPTSEATLKRELKIAMLVAVPVVAAGSIAAGLVNWAVSLAVVAVVLGGAGLLGRRWGRLPRQDTGKN